MNGELLRVALNDRVLSGPRSGIGHYVAELIEGVPAADPGIHLLPFYQTYLARFHPRRATRGASGTPGRRWPAPIRQAIEKLYQSAFRHVGRRHGCVLYHEPCHIPGPWDGVTLTTIHDLSVVRHPAWHPPDRVRWYETQFRAALCRSQHFVSVSEFTRREMTALLGISPERITVIPLAARSSFRPRNPDDVRAWLARSGLPTTYLLYVGTIEPRKNLPGIFAAYAALPPARRERYPLLVAGAPGWGRDDMQGWIERFELRAHVRLLGYQEDEALAYLYAGARALVWPTFYEGFGLPPLEAMATGTPVIAARCSSIPEVVGDAGLLVNPQNVPQIRDAVLSIIEDDALAAALSAAGRQRSRAFSWARCAKEHAALYRRLAT